MTDTSFGRTWIVGVALCMAWMASGGSVLAEADEPEVDPALMCMTVDDFLNLERVVAEALISDCDTGTAYCVEYTGTIGTGPTVSRGDAVVIRYSAWVVPDMAQVTARELWEYDIARAPVRDRRLQLEAGETGPIGLRTALYPRGGDLPRVGSITWLVLPRAIAGVLRDDLPRIPEGGAVAARVELLQP